MRWIPTAIMALILAFSDRNLLILAACTIVCLYAYYEAMHFDAQIIAFLSAFIREYSKKG